MFVCLLFFFCLLNPKKCWNISLKALQLKELKQSAWQNIKSHSFFLPNREKKIKATRRKKEKGNILVSKSISFCIIILLNPSLKVGKALLSGSLVKSIPRSVDSLMVDSPHLVLFIWISGSSYGNDPLVQL